MLSALELHQQNHQISLSSFETDSRPNTVYWMTSKLDSHFLNGKFYWFLLFSFRFCPSRTLNLEFTFSKDGPSVERVRGEAWKKRVIKNSIKEQFCMNKKIFPGHCHDVIRLAGITLVCPFVRLYSLCEILLLVSALIFKEESDVIDVVCSKAGENFHLISKVDYSCPFLFH